ncbi:hypothetical protein H4R26_005807 [Coemansia thaxteri]|uniref:Uncharacterized protein n=1 Tax=Coemansia thaxteri TaxID=2663907 RepID=A0A9W8EFI3_9FUNG|nr:hypothetical protein H4R26_005807 [Coemansia thaxteri]KAJ2474707.1 hypothetical protein EV174_005538 [Coemansia sp. RSA 2320]
MQACYIATAFFTVVTLATFQDKYNFMDINTIIFYDAVTLVLAGLLNYVEPYWSLKSFCIAFALAYGLHAYFAVGIVRATTILGSHAKPSISVAVSAAMLYPFLMVAGLDLKDIAYN